jgi:XTP/dITP diphosphohydrolase
MGNNALKNLREMKGLSMPFFLHLCLMQRKDEKLQAFERLLIIMDELREQCPWDKKQTMETLRHLTIEEMYELTDAIIKKDSLEIKKELGDVMLHLIFYARIASETGEFDIADVLNAQCDKLITRHPHIYGDTIAETEEEVRQNWEQIKLKEGNKSVLSGVPNGMPAMIKAMRMQEKVAQVGFDWDNKEQVWAKVMEELGEYTEEIKKGTDGKTEEEFGDLLFALINYSRHAGINPENALEKTNIKFRNRFMYIENEAGVQGKKITDMNLDEMDVLWNAAKKNE